jgi:DNA-binding protein HU-beta
MTTNELVERIAQETGGTKADARKQLDLVFRSIIAAAAESPEITVSGFGKFKVKDTKPRISRHPSTGELLTIASTRKLGFTPAKVVRDRLNG